MYSGWETKPPIDITSVVHGITNLRLRTHTCVYDGGGAQLEVEFQSNRNVYEDHGFIENPPGCWTEQYNSDFCHAASWDCTEPLNEFMSNGAAIDIALVKDGGGRAIWSDATPYENTGFEAAAVCKKADAAGICNFGTGPIACFTDVMGIEQCPTNNGSTKQESCKALQDTGCTFASEECVNGARDLNTGKCYVYKAKYKCSSYSVNVGGDVDVTSTVGCNAMRCMGTSCTDLPVEKNSGYPQVNALLAAPNSFGQDGDCTSGGCKIFKGKPLTCKTAIGGLFDCCTSNAKGINFMDYFKVGQMVYKQAQAQGWVGQLPSASLPNMGQIVNFANNTISTMTQLTSGTVFETPWTALTANLPTFSVNNPITAGYANQSITNFAAKWVAKTFPNLTASLSSTFTTNLSSSTMEVLADAQSMASAVYSVFVYAYLAYTLLSIAFACKDEEFELDAQKQMKTCNYVGSYCSGKIKLTGSCFETKESWCCYGSVLSKVMQREIRKYLPGGMGTAEAPICDGLTPAELSNPAIKWDEFDTKDFEAMMVDALIKPKAGQEHEFYKMENITKVNTGEINGDVIARGDTSVGINKVDSLKLSSGMSNGNTARMDVISGNVMDQQMSGWPPP